MPAKVVLSLPIAHACQGCFIIAHSSGLPRLFYHCPYFRPAKVVLSLAIISGRPRLFNYYKTTKYKLMIKQPWQAWDMGNDNTTLAGLRYQQCEQDKPSLTDLRYEHCQQAKFIRPEQIWAIPTSQIWQAWDMSNFKRPVLADLRYEQC